ncbi:hypothetical protein [Auraticoccus monumenti]|uniref:Pectate lyase superfamily protein n=1 Tax=Auraticoccus monumenti TaxID=675864 RepID=A0A1G6WG10_9ACTN|nr:hypothetical protein [Auraticoccus monumenti]SDD64663.1 hypothetical protein SAMN04489747_1431 [Auraticoccus monumenti]
MDQNAPTIPTDDGRAVGSPRRDLLRASALAAAAVVGTGVALGAARPAAAEPPRRPGRIRVVDAPLSPLDREFGFDYTPGADNTDALQAVIDKAMSADGGQVVLPAGDIWVRGLSVDYRGFPTQNENGLPYGYAGPKITGAGMRQTRINQLPGSTADIVTVSGHVGDKAGPANNNKATGVTLADLQLQGTPGGGHGLYLRSLVNCEFRNLWIQRTGGSGIFRERATFVSGLDDEYSYANSWDRIKIVAPGRWGVEDSTKASIGGSMTNVEAISPTLGGFLLAPTNMTLLDCQAIGGTVGLQSVRNENRRSVNSGLTLINFRSEGSRGSHEILIEAGISHLIVNPNFFPTSGAHCLGVGLREEGPDFHVRNLTVVGGYFGVVTKYPEQLAVELGTDARSTRLIHPTLELNNGRVPTDLVVDRGYRSSIELPGDRTEDHRGFTSHHRAVAQVPAPESGVNEGWEEVAEGRWEKVAVFPGGRRVVIAS